ncbi:hypothetical protein [Candidatus Enterococcus mansonii]|uniref:Uncharacterized protein n=1 Tax=Candidatus Enterococcus mansonii TaxID=1834181 RepID=A0A242BTM4_9ENTE|nr:hypothetical protein [Enterococcus sp. 4G2_DIV0659]OTO01358.1 hypothetical protein A5880_003200 [Enterococcus sp. 4G2_DIV0659]
MGKAISKRKSKVQYRDICLPIDLIRKVTTVRTFDKRTWVNMWDGSFARRSVDGSGVDKVELLHGIFDNIQTAAEKDIVVARKDHPEQVLRFLVSPYVIGRRK